MSNPPERSKPGRSKTVRFHMPKGVVEHFNRMKASDAERSTPRGVGIWRLSKLLRSLSVSGALVMVIACGCLAMVVVVELSISR